MVKAGRYNTLRVVKTVPFGIYLDGGEDGEILLPTRYVPEGCKVGDELKVFIYFDSEDEIIATTQRPRGEVGKFAFLEVIDTTPIGAFLDWGLAKDLLAPFSEQRRKMQKGKSYLVYIKLDSEGRIIATTKIDKYLGIYPPRYKEGEEVSLVIAERSDIGIKAIVNDSHWGVLYDEEIFKELTYGKRIKGYIKRVREDGKIDLTLNKPGFGKIEDLADIILKELNKKGGFLPLHDKTPADVIYRQFGQSKKSFKSAIGQLYKKRLITIDDDGIRLV